MRFCAVHRMAFLVFAMLTGDGIAFAMGRMPGECSKQLFGGGPARRSNSKSEALQQLSEAVKKDAELHLVEAGYLLPSDQYGVPTGTESLGNPVLVGRRGESLKPRISKQEWDHLVLLWENFLKTQALASRRTWEENLCGPGEYAEAFENAPKLLAIVPPTVFEDPKASLGMAALGTVGFAADAVTVVPSNLLLYGGKLRHEHYENAAYQALQQFFDAVVSAERRVQPH